ncbi:Tachykinin-like peptides receptor 99D [Sarcoptes scabiei]|uniref:Tachykinin-like peptides receptor 99D n=1 Tax=Sarcoptes scabiei TaxID=52283 RepID=A0A834REM1_SARSC|nr:Tachykinin-like peptides receptor 99D [Sarcoptes scabiei]
MFEENVTQWLSQLAFSSSSFSSSSSSSSSSTLITNSLISKLPYSLLLSADTGTQSIESIKIEQSLFQHLIESNENHNRNVASAAVADDDDLFLTTPTTPATTFTETFIWSLLFYPMVVFAAIGNLLIIWIIATKPLMRNIVNQYLVNLTLSDFLSATFNAGFNFFFMLHQHWPFGNLYCMANNFIANLTIVSSVSTMMLISIDR